MLPTRVDPLPRTVSSKILPNVPPPRALRIPRGPFYPKRTTREFIMSRCAPRKLMIIPESPKNPKKAAATCPRRTLTVRNALGMLDTLRKSSRNSENRHSYKFTSRRIFPEGVFLHKRNARRPPGSFSKIARGGGGRPFLESSQLFFPKSPRTPLNDKAARRQPHTIATRALPQGSAIHDHLR